MIGLTSIALSATIMPDILRTIYMKQKQTQNYFRLVTLKTVHLNDREFRSYNIAGTLDKQYVLATYHNFVKFGQCIIVFLTPHQPTRLDMTTETYHRT